MRKTKAKKSHWTRNRFICKAYGVWSPGFPLFILADGELLALEQQSSGDMRGKNSLLFPSQQRIQNNT